MTRSPDQRLDRIEDEFDTVKQLLASAARYAESANEKLDRLSERQDRTQAQLDRLTIKVDDLTAAQTQTQTQLDQLTIKVDDLTAAQAQTQTQLNQLTQKVDQLSGRVDEFIFQTSRVFVQQGERMIQVEGLTESLTGIVQRLDRNYQGQQSQMQEFQRTTNAALERMDRILDYLLGQHRG